MFRFGTDLPHHVRGNGAQRLGRARPSVLALLFLLAGCDPQGWTRMLERTCENHRSCSCESADCARPGRAR